MLENPFPALLKTQAVRSLPAQEELWRSIFLFNLYRLVLAILLVLVAGTLADALGLGSSNLPLFFRTSVAYVALVLLSQLTIKLRQPRFGLQLAFQIGIDIACLTVLAHASGGIQSGLGILLLVSLAAAGLISRGQITLFFAALASIAVLLEHSYAVVVQDAPVALYLQAGLLSTAYFAIAWLAHTLARYAVASEKLAFVRGVDLLNMAEANQLVIQDMPDGVLVVDRNGVVRQFNRSAERLLEYAFPRGGGVGLAECSPLLAEQFSKWQQETLRKSGAFRLPGIFHRARVHFLPVQREGFWGAVVFLEDMQHVREQAQQIKLAALGRLTANIAHEVRNPLASISYATELLREGGHDPAQERLFQIILDNTSRLNRIVQDVMRLNQRDRAQPEPVQLSGMLSAFAEGLCQAERVGSDVVRVDAVPDCVVNFDRGHLEQVLWNLCSNALRYCSKQPGSVELRLERISEGQVRLEISDDGPGVPLEAESQLFEPFFTTAAGGTGLGLYIARELCEANGAELRYMPGVSGGAHFQVLFVREGE